MAWLNVKKLFGLKGDEDITEEEKKAAAARMKARGQSSFVVKQKELEDMEKKVRKQNTKK